MPRAPRTMRTGSGNALTTHPYLSDGLARTTNKGKKGLEAPPPPRRATKRPPAVPHRRPPTHRRSSRAQMRS